MFIQEIGGELFGPNTNWRKVNVNFSHANAARFVTAFGGDSVNEKSYACMKNGIVMFPYKIVETKAENTDNGITIESAARLFVTKKGGEINEFPRIISLQGYQASLLEENDYILLAYLFKAKVVHHNQVSNFSLLSSKIDIREFI